MIYGLEQIVAPPPVSALLSLLLIAGCDKIGVILLRAFGFAPLDNQRWQRWQAPLVGALVLGVVLYPLALAGLTPRTLMQGVAFLCLGLGLLHSAKFLYEYACIRPAGLGASFFCKFRAKIFGRMVNIPSPPHGWNILFILLLVGFGLLALGPATNADSLDYHLGVAIALLNNGGMPVMPEWFTSRTAGNGEVLNALGLSIGAEQFGSLLQFSGLMGIAGLLLCAEPVHEHPFQVGAVKINSLVAIAALSAPVLLFLVSSPKPQLLPIAMTTLAMALVIYPSQRQLPPRKALLTFALICLLVMEASQAKITYMLGGGVVGLLAFAKMAKRGLLLPSLGVGALTALLIIGPPMIWKVYYFDADFVDALTKPLPGNWPIGSYETILRTTASADSDFFFPLSIVVPSGIDNLSTVFGAGIILLIALRPGRDPWLWCGVASAILVMLVAAVLGPPSARHYLEPYFWLLMVLVLQPTQNLLHNYPHFKWLVYGQALATIALCWFGIATLLPGALTSEWRSKVMARSANGYDVMKWADSVLPPDAVLLNGHRSMALAPRDAVSMEWSNFINIDSPLTEPYLERIKERGVTHMLVLGGGIPDAGGFAGCVGPVVAGPGYGHVATRNPFNAGEQYKAWIFKFNSEQLPGCAKTQK